MGIQREPNEFNFFRFTRIFSSKESKSALQWVVLVRYIASKRSSESADTIAIARFNLV
eukprot:m.149956 g.149956  ORF g.149956 m.149956 type:complete len:58 (-) comp30694_c0_seq1:1165-1338(-)